jgi:hypothetical protein
MVLILINAHHLHQGSDFCETGACLIIGQSLVVAKEGIMKVVRTVVGAIALLATFAASGASAQGINLSGPWQCVAQCLAPQGSFAYITQYGWELNLVNEAGVPSRAWIDYPGHIWVQRANQGAIYSPDGFTIQFDSGTVWQRPQPVPPPLRSRG